MWYYYIMISNKSSIHLFILCCIPARLVISLLPLYLSKKYLFYYGIILLIIALSFLYLYFTNQRLNAQEAGGYTWWAKFRLIHGLLYLCGAIYCIQGKRIAYIPLLADTIIGIMLSVNHHYLRF